MAAPVGAQELGVVIALRAGEQAAGVGLDAVGDAAGWWRKGGAGVLVLVAVSDVLAHQAKGAFGSVVVFGGGNCVTPLEHARLTAAGHP